MNGADEYAALFSTGQYGRLYLVSGEHARGRTFHIFVLPAGEIAIENGPNNGPRNTEAVEVYGIVAGNPGWTESYGWKHRGKWQEDFLRLVCERRNALALAKQAMLRERQAEEAVNAERIRTLLEAY